MIKKVLNVTIFTVLILFVCSTNSLAKQWEDINLPISFNIEALPWEEVNEIVPNKSTFTIIDVETGLSFNVQRRAGSRHADVQPLTFKDTEIMHEIYNKKWSWNRRAILVLKGDQLIAASMSGMPHGKGALRNGFNGHFCVHFYGSKTHRTRTLDFAHQMMVLKAAGKLDEFISISSPIEILQLLAVAINHKDEPLMKSLLAKTNLSDSFLNDVNEIERIKLNPINVDFNSSSQLVNVEIPTKYEIITEDNETIKGTISMIVIRDSLFDQWKIDPSSFLQN